LHSSRGDIEHINRRAHRGGLKNYILQLIAVECRPESPPSPAYDVLYDEDDQRRSEAALTPLSLSPAEGVTVKALGLQAVGRESNSDSEGFFRASYSENG
jgi:hypothetical protein